MPNPDPASDARQHSPPPAAPGRRGELLLGAAIVLLIPGPLLAATALAAGDPGVGVLAARVCRVALALSGPRCLLAALRASR